MKTLLPVLGFCSAALFAAPASAHDTWSPTVHLGIGYLLGHHHSHKRCGIPRHYDHGYRSHPRNHGHHRGHGHRHGHQAHRGSHGHPQYRPHRGHVHGDACYRRYPRWHQHWH